MFSVFFFKHKPAYGMRISDLSSDVCSSDLFGIADGRHASLSAPYPCQAHGAHQPLDRAFGYCRSLSAHLVPDLARAIEAGAVVVDTLDLLLDLVIAPGSRLPFGRVSKPVRMFVGGGSGAFQRTEHLPANH